MAKGRWSKLEGRFPQSPLGNMSMAHDSGFVQRVNERKLEWGALTLKEKLELLVEAREIKDALEDIIKSRNVDIEALGQLLLIELEAQDLTSCKTATGQTLYMSIEPYVGIKDRALVEAYVDADPDLAYLWSIHPGTLGTYVKELLETGQDEKLPPGVDVFLKKSVRLRKS